MVFAGVDVNGGVIDAIDETSSTQTLIIIIL